MVSGVILYPAALKCIMQICIQALAGRPGIFKPQKQHYGKNIRCTSHLQANVDSGQCTCVYTVHTIQLNYQKDIALKRKRKLMTHYRD